MNMYTMQSKVDLMAKDKEDIIKYNVQSSNFAVLDN